MEGSENGFVKRQSCAETGPNSPSSPQASEPSAAVLLQPFGHETGEPWGGAQPTARALAECIADLATSDRQGLIQRVRNIIVRDRATVVRRWERFKDPAEMLPGVTAHLGGMLALVRLKYGNLDPDVNAAFDVAMDVYQKACSVQAKALGAATASPAERPGTAPGPQSLINPEA